MKKINFKKILSFKNAAFSLFIFGAVFLIGHIALASASEAIGNIVGSVIAVFIRAVSSILILLVNVLMSVAAYSDFINAPAVFKGWIVVRDVCNLFFVIILLIIAFATILGKEEYGAKKMLPKLVLAAVLINFSKLICGLMIDISSVVMLTFINAFSSVGAGNILDILGIAEVTRISVSNDDSGLVTFGTIISAYIFGLIYVVIATVVVAAMLGMLVVRVVMIWILVVLSPLAFFLEAVPGKGATYAGQWWSNWTSNLLVGPIIAFFLWLSFASLQGGNPIVANESNDLANNNVGIVDSSGLGSKAGTTSAMSKFVIAIGMLLGGMKIAQGVGGEAGSAMGKIFSKGKGTATAAGIGALVASRKAVGRGTLLGVGKVSNIFSKTDQTTGERKGNALGNFALQWREDLLSERKKEKVAKREKFLKKLGISDKAADKGRIFLETKEMQNIGKGAKSSSQGAATGAAIGSFAGPIGTVVGATIGATIGVARGYVSKKRAEKIKTKNKSYEDNKTAGGRDDDKKIIESIRSRKLEEKPDSWTADEKNAVVRMKEYEKNKKILEGKTLEGVAMGPDKSYQTTITAAKNMNKEKEAAREWVKISSNNPNFLKNSGKGDFYSSGGFNKTNKLRFSEIEKDTNESDKLVGNMLTEVSGNTLSTEQLDGLARAIAAFKKDNNGTLNQNRLGKIEQELSNKGYSVAADQVFTNYKQVGANMKVESGSGALQYDAFAKNSAKKPMDRNSKKDIIGVSFGKINEKAEAMGVDYKLDSAAGVNQKIGDAQLGKLTTVMNSLLDDEISTLEKAGANVNNNQKIDQLKTAKARLSSDGLSSLSLKNTDVVYDGETDSQRRRNEYNTTQHETMHQYGAQDEEAVDSAAGALQEAKLVGRIPKSDVESGGKSYEEVLGKMIASLEQKGSSKEEISQAVVSQIDKWTPSNAQRVVETEKGERETVKDMVAETNGKEIDFSKITNSIDRLTESLSNPIKSADEKNLERVINLSIPATNFFRRMFEQVKTTIKKDDIVIGEKLKPLSALAINEESGSSEREEA